MNIIIPLISGLIFGFGLMISGMTQPGKVIGFLDILGAWQWDLMGVMGSALVVNGIGYAIMKRREGPLLSGFQFPNFKIDLDRRLLGGAALFGLGWGLAGICPGPALVSLATLKVELLTFVGMMLAGMLLMNWLDSRG